jgi:hypothetical protein
MLCGSATEDTPMTLGSLLRPSPPFDQRLDR